VREALMDRQESVPLLRNAALVGLQVAMPLQQSGHRNDMPIYCS
jgi:hypothetical protein